MLIENSEYRITLVENKAGKHGARKGSLSDETSNKLSGLDNVDEYPKQVIVWCGNS